MFRYEIGTSKLSLEDLDVWRWSSLRHCCHWNHRLYRACCEWEL